VKGEKGTITAKPGSIFNNPQKKQPLICPKFSA